jgi:putative DNA primase/helicase
LSELVYDDGMATTDRVYDLDDEGNASRFADYFDGELMFVSEYKKWFYWTGSHWAQSIGQETEAAMRFIQLMHQEDAVLLATGRLEEHKRLSAHITKTAGKIPYLLALAAKTPKLRADVTWLDNQKSWINFGNAVVDLKSAALMVPDPMDRLTKRTGVLYTIGAEAPMWEAFLAEVLPDPAVREYVQRLAGYSLLGDVSERLIVFLYGTGRNGKSVFVEVVRELLGNYAVGTPVTTFLKKNGSESSNDLARLRGARFIAASEFEEGARVNTALLKRVTGDENITARPLYGEFFDFPLEGTIWISTNHMPFVGNDRAVWDRIKVIPFTTRIEEDKVDVRIKQKLLTEGPGILQWLLDGARQYLASGLEEPTSLLQTRLGMRTDQDLLAPFVEECCEVDAAYSATSAELYRAYMWWAVQAGEKPCSKRTFGLRLTESGYQPFRTSNARGYQGLRPKTGAWVNG